MLFLRLHIKGKVFRTGYRYYIKQIASRFEINGCVFYCHDKSVEIVATGEEHCMDEFISHCRSGNKDSLVEEVHISQIPPAVFESFEVIDKV